MSINGSEIGLTGGGWYIAIGYRYLHKDLRLHSRTGYNGGMKWGKAPGYYPTEAIAQAYLNEWFRKNDERGYEMKKGDRVLLNDSSWSMMTTTDGLKQFDVGPIRGSCKDVWKIIATSSHCCLPSCNYSDSIIDYTNNTIIQNIKTKSMVFTQTGFLKPVAHIIDLDGKKIELSEKSYNNFKKQFQDD